MLKAMRDRRLIAAEVRLGDLLDLLSALRAFDRMPGERCGEEVTLPEGARLIRAALGPEGVADDTTLRLVFETDDPAVPTYLGYLTYLPATPKGEE